MTLPISTMWLFLDLCLMFFFFCIFFVLFVSLFVFCHSQAIKRRSRPQKLLVPYFPKSLFGLIGMVCDACLPSDVYFPWHLITFHLLAYLSTKCSR